MTYGVGFYRRRARVFLEDDAVFASGSTAAGIIARYRLNAAGTIQTKAGTAAYVNEGNWLLSGANTEFEAQYQQEGPITGTGGSFTGTSASWVAMTADKEITFSSSIGGAGHGNLRVKIRDKTTLVELASALIAMDSEGV